MSIIVVLAAILLAATTVWPPGKWTVGQWTIGRWTVGQTVQTTSGAVAGHAASVASDVSEYLGIPYAQPPVGSLRFQPPVRYNGTGGIDGRNFVGHIFLLTAPMTL